MNATLRGPSAPKPAPAADASQTLASLLRARARATSDGALVLAAAVGLLAALGDLGWRPRGWTAILCLGICVGVFGLYGIADRELESPLAPHSTTATKTWRGVRIAAATLGAVAGFTLLLELLTVVLGTWIS